MKTQLLHGAVVLGLAAGLALAENETSPKSSAKPAPSAPAKAAKAAKPATPAPMDPAAVKSNSSYGFGFQTGSRFANQAGGWGLTTEDLETDMFIKGFLDAFAGKKPQIEDAKIQAAMQQLGGLLKQREAKIAQQNLEAGKAFLAKNAKRKNVVCADSGLQYEVLEKGGDRTYKAPTDGSRDNTRFLVKYRGTLIDGAEFDKSPEDRPVPMTLGVIPGFKEALTKMPVGAKWRLYIPSNLAYGERRRSAKIGPNSTLIFDLELVDIQKPAPRRAVSPPIQVPPPKSGKNATGRTTKPRAVSQPVQIPPPPKKDGAKPAKPRAVSQPVEIPPPPKKK